MSSWIDWLKPTFALPCGLKVEVVLPVPDSPMMRMSFGASWPSFVTVGVSFAPACSTSPPSSYTFALSMRRPPFFDSPK